METEKSMKVIRPKIEAARHGGLLLIDFKAWAAPVTLGVLSVRERLGDRQTRAVWDDVRNPGVRVAVNVTEHVSSAEALEALAVELEANQLADLPAGPPALGEVSFVHPDGVPPAVFFARANVTVWVMSFGSLAVQVVPIARQIDDDLRSRPVQARAGGLDVIATGNVIRARMHFPAADSYLKVFAPGAELRHADDAIVVIGDVAEIEVFALEAGREILSATAQLPVR
jgi:hypothetical protein